MKIYGRAENLDLDKLNNRLQTTEQKDKAIKVIVEKKREVEDRFRICN